MPTKVNPSMTTDLLRTDVINQTLTVDTVVKNGGLNALCPIGTVILWPNAPTLGVPNGWAECDGSLRLVASYPELFAVIEDYYGGDGITDFALPNITATIPTGLTGGLWIIRLNNPAK